VTVKPAGPLEAENGNEVSRVVRGVGGFSNRFPHFRVVVEKAHPPVVVIGERGEVEAGDVACVVVVVRRRAASVREIRMPVQVAPELPRNTAANDQRVALCKQRLATGFRCRAHAVEARFFDAGGHPRASATRRIEADALW